MISVSFIKVSEDSVRARSAGCLGVGEPSFGEEAVSDADAVEADEVFWETEFGLGVDVGMVEGRVVVFATLFLIELDLDGRGSGLIKLLVFTRFWIAGKVTLLQSYTSIVANFLWCSNLF
jgi:hypothetical protein